VGAFFGNFEHGHVKSPNDRDWKVAAITPWVRQPTVQVGFCE
jgi:hypothetical protein